LKDAPKQSPTKANTKTIAIKIDQLIQVSVRVLVCKDAPFIPLVKAQTISATSWMEIAENLDL
jgi:hypothetical protein